MIVSIGEKIGDLVAAVNHKWAEFNAWELEFISDMNEKIEDETWEPSEKQEEIINNLWERV